MTMVESLYDWDHYALEPVSHADLDSNLLVMPSAQALDTANIQFDLTADITTNI